MPSTVTYFVNDPKRVNSRGENKVRTDRFYMNRDSGLQCSSRFSLHFTLKYLYHIYDIIKAADTERSNVPLYIKHVP